MRYEGYVNDSLYDFWVNFCIDEVYLVGWCVISGKFFVFLKCKEILFYFLVYKLSFKIYISVYIWGDKFLR